MINLTIDPEVRNRWSGAAVLGILEMQNLKTTPLPSTFKQEVATCLSEIRAKGEAVFDEPAIRRMRATFKAMPDMDPTRYRPASEALIRRFLTKDFFRINPIVDINNLLSVRSRVPLGVYDGERLHSACTYRTGAPGESYMTISEASKSAEGKLVLADPAGVVGSPVSDSGRAIIRDDTSHAVMIAYLPFDTSIDDAYHLCEMFEAEFLRYLGGESLQRVVMTSDASPKGGR